MGQPAVHLPIVEPVGFAEALEPACLPVDTGQARRPVDELDAEPVAGFQVGVEGCRPSVGVHRGPAVDHAHQIEARSHHAVVVARRIGLRVGHIGAVECLEDAVLTQHGLVAALGHDPRWATQHRHEVAPRDAEDLVRRAAADETDRDGLSLPGQVALVHPRPESALVHQARGARLCRRLFFRRQFRHVVSFLPLRRRPDMALRSSRRPSSQPARCTARWAGPRLRVRRSASA